LLVKEALAGVEILSAFRTVAHSIKQLMCGRVESFRKRNIEPAGGARDNEQMACALVDRGNLGCHQRGAARVGLGVTRLD
jgi:hypothetical protein